MIRDFKSINSNAEKLAQSVIQATGMLEPNVVDLIKWFKESFNFGLEVVFIDLRKSNISGYVVPINEAMAYKIFVDRFDAESRQLFTICHEIGHIFRNLGLSYGCSDGQFSSKGEERFCDRFAAAFLMPKELFINFWSMIDDDDASKMFKIRERFSVSRKAAYFRVKELNLLS